MTALLDAPPAIVPAAVVAFFAVGTAFGYVLVKRAIMAAPLPAQRAAESNAAAETIVRLDALDLAGDPPDAYAQLAREVRRYLDARFRLATAPMAGAEIERALTRAGVARPAARMASHLLERCARIAAGSTGVERQRLADDVESARNVVRALDAC